ncbi:M56 family metallopeptidase [Pedobacter changchengzhani]|uniref:M56 family metallopeptidase n=1 Tax=Pedobacter changchengzhani TaxID=2529274 RepID=UPI0014043304|nr:M56 family metallopeptidase [Pedobacter changchengzhani]
MILSSFFAFIIPFFQLGFLKQANSLVLTSRIESIEQVNLPINSAITTIQQSFFTIENFILTIYAFVAILFFCKLCVGLFSIFKLIKKPFNIIENDVKLIYLKNSGIAFSFFNLLFLDSNLSQRSTIIKHELVHIRQKHSLDVLFFEIIQSINWFNPFCYLLKKDIKLIHEYLADEATTQNEVEKYDYAIFLIQNSQRINIVNLTNQIFSSSILKQRINMLNQKKSSSWARLKFLFILPLVVGLISLSTMAFTKNYSKIDLYSKGEKLDFNQQDSINKKNKLKQSVAKSATIKELDHTPTLQKTILLAPPPKPKKSEYKGETYKIDLILDRTKGEKLIAPDSEKGEKSVSIYSERGEKIFVTDNYKNDWDGKVNFYTKKSLPAGNYSYVITIAKTEKSKAKVIQGYISLR